MAGERERECGRREGESEGVCWERWEGVWWERVSVVGEVGGEMVDSVSWCCI